MKWEIDNFSGGNGKGLECRFETNERLRLTPKDLSDFYIKK